ncbi:MAG: zinc-ribbon domain-containing protein [Ruminococcus sp.]|nr:zinc-ribbon domain-containing protein [Ruminococcus sp.]
MTKTKYIIDNAELMAEWDWEKNNALNINPQILTQGSHMKVWWKCDNGHSWQASPNHRASKHRGCPYCCHNPIVLEGTNDLATCNPVLAKEWNNNKNGTLLPSQVTLHSNKKVWWKCDRGHEWKTSVNHRANGSNCPLCSKSKQTSFPEQAIYYYIKRAYPDAINGYTEIFNNHGMELDVYIPSWNIGVEYDGMIFHKTTKQQLREINKYNICKNNNIFLIRIREDLKPPIKPICDEIIYLTSNLNNAIQKLSKFLPYLNNIDVNRDELIIKSKFLSDFDDKSLSSLYPELCREWNYDKNLKLTPKMFLPHSNTKVWWRCSNKHEWKASIDGRVKGHGCPYCCNRKVLTGYNDLAHKRPDLIKEWDYTNNTISPDTVLPGSGKVVWWICSTCGHHWKAEISSRNKGHSCPICAKMKKR